MRKTLAGESLGCGLRQDRQASSRSEAGEGTFHERGSGKGGTLATNGKLCGKGHEKTQCGHSDQVVSRAGDKSGRFLPGKLNTCEIRDRSLALKIGNLSATP